MSRRASASRRQHRVDADPLELLELLARRDARLRDDDLARRHVGEQVVGALEVDGEVGQVAVVDADARRRRARARARARRSSWTSTSTSRSRSRASRCRSAEVVADRSAATISRIASAPAAADSYTWYGSTMKSLRSTGRSVAARAARRSSSEPPKCVRLGEHRQRGGAAALVGGDDLLDDVGPRGSRRPTASGACARRSSRCRGGSAPRRTAGPRRGRSSARLELGERDARGGGARRPGGCDSTMRFEDVHAARVRGGTAPGSSATSAVERRARRRRRRSPPRRRARRPRACRRGRRRRSRRRR